MKPTDMEFLQNNDMWNNDLIQFARLLSEINATQSDLDMAALAEVMDLDATTIGEIFDRANTVFTKAKSNLK